MSHHQFFSIVHFYYTIVQNHSFFSQPKRCNCRSEFLSADFFYGRSSKKETFKKIEKEVSSFGYQKCYTSTVKILGCEQNFFKVIKFINSLLYKLLQ